LSEGYRNRNPIQFAGGFSETAFAGVSIFLGANWIARLPRLPVSLPSPMAVAIGAAARATFFMPVPSLTAASAAAGGVAMTGITLSPVQTDESPIHLWRRGDGRDPKIVTSAGRVVTSRSGIKPTSRIPVRRGPDGDWERVSLASREGKIISRLKN